MSRAATFASAADELRTGLTDSALCDEGVLSPLLITFILSGVAIGLGVRGGPDGRPIAGFANGARVCGRAIRLVVNRVPNADVIAALEAGSPVAATLTRAVDHRSIQLKASVARVETPGAADLEHASHQSAAFRDQLVSVKYDPAWAAVYMSFERSQMAVIEFVPELGLVLSPGPDAGLVLKP